MHEAEAELILDARNIVGESLVWDDRRNRLVWVDIIGRKIHRLDPLSADHQSWDTPDLVTSIGLRADGGAIVGLRKEIASWDFGGPFRTIARIESDHPDTRLNEGVGRAGRFVLGRHHDEQYRRGRRPDRHHAGRRTALSGRRRRRGDAPQRRSLRHHQHHGLERRMAASSPPTRRRTSSTAIAWTARLHALTTGGRCSAVLRAACPTGRAWIPTATSGTAASPAAAASSASRPTARWTGRWSCLAAGRPAAPSAAKISTRCSSPRLASR